MSDSPRFDIRIAETDAAVAAVAADEEPTVTGTASGNMPTYRTSIDAALRVLDQMVLVVDDTRRVRVRVYDGRGEGHTTAWTAPSAAAGQLRKVAADLDFQAELDRETPVPG